MKNHADALIVSNSEQVRWAICAGASQIAFIAEERIALLQAAGEFLFAIPSRKRSGMEGWYV